MMTMQGTTRKKAMDKARRQSTTKESRENNLRVYSFRWDIESNQYYNQGEYYTLAVASEKSFNVGGKSDIRCYINGKKREEQ